MFAEVVPNRRLPKQFSGFTYEIPKSIEVQAGQFVVVPLRKQQVIGVVTRLHDNPPPYAAKPIERALPLHLPHWLLALALWMEEKYETSVSSVLQSMIPDSAWPTISPKKTRASKEKSADSEILPPRVQNSPYIPSALHTFTRNLLDSPNPKLVIERGLLPRKFLYQAMRNSLPADKQLLIVEPETFHANQYKDFFTIFHGELTAREKGTIWTGVAVGTIQTVCGSRSSLFLPFQNLGAIVVDEEHNENYFEKRSPKYHALDVAKKIAEFNNIPLIVISATPRVDTWHAAKNNNTYEVHTWEAEICSLQILPMADERHRGNNGILAEETTESIARTLAQGGQVLLFTHRTGQAGALLCQDCGHIFRCPKCTNAFAVHTGNLLKCHTCRTTQGIPHACPMCNNVRLKSIGFGTQAVEKEMKSTFGKATIMRLDSETKSKTRIADAQNADILIATSIVDKPLDLPRLALSVAVMPDSLFQFPHFRAAERVMQLLTRLRLLTRPDGTMIFQTFLPEHPLLLAIEKNSLNGFYESEIAVRRTLMLPPFTRPV